MSLCSWDFAVRLLTGVLTAASRVLWIDVAGSSISSFAERDWSASSQQVMGPPHGSGRRERQLRPTNTSARDCGDAITVLAEHRLINSPFTSLTSVASRQLFCSPVSCLVYPAEVLRRNSAGLGQCCVQHGAIVMLLVSPAFHQLLHHLVHWQKITIGVPSSVHVQAFVLKCCSAPGTPSVKYTVSKRSLQLTTYCSPILQGGRTGLQPWLSPRKLARMARCCALMLSPGHGRC